MSFLQKGKSITVIADNIPEYIINDSEQAATGECGKVIFYTFDSAINQYKDETN